MQQAHLNVSRTGFIGRAFFVGGDMHAIFAVYDELLRISAALIASASIYWSAKPLAPTPLALRAAGMAVAVIAASFAWSAVFGG